MRVYEFLFARTNEYAFALVRQVSWVRRHEDNEKMTLLTYGLQTYSGDPRYTVEFQYPDNWRLQIRYVNSSDEGQYECQINTHPLKTIHVNLHINGKYDPLVIRTLGTTIFGGASEKFKGSRR